MWSSTRVDAVERERREQGIARHRLAHAGHRRGVLVAEQVAAEARLGALRVLELDDRHALDGFLAHAEQPRRHLGDHVVVVGLQAVEVAALAGAGEGVPGHRGAGLAEDGVDADRPERHAAAVHREVDVDLRPAIVAAVQIQARVDLFAPDRSPCSAPWTSKVEAGCGRSRRPMRRAGIPDAGGGRMPGLGHVPGGQDQIAGPARIAHARRRVGIARAATAPSCGHWAMQ